MEGNMKIIFGIHRFDQICLILEHHIVKELTFDRIHALAFIVLLARVHCYVSTLRGVCHITDYIITGWYSGLRKQSLWS